MGGAYSNFKPWLRTDKLILKFKKKYRQNRREKLRRTMYFSADSEFHATTLLILFYTKKKFSAIFIFYVFFILHT